MSTEKPRLTPLGKGQWACGITRPIESDERILFPPWVTRVYVDGLAYCGPSFRDAYDGWERYIRPTNGS